jgi:hypothetical protein
MLNEVLSDQQLSEKLNSLYRCSLSIGGLSIHVLGDRCSDVSFDAEQSRFEVDAGYEGINIRVRWTEEIPQIPARWMFDSGTTWRLYEHRDGFRFDFGDPISVNKPHKRLLVDTSFRHADLEMSEEYFSAYPQVANPLGYPLDELLIMHRLTQERAIELHGSGIVRANGAANLFVGHSGAGKSTTTRLWTTREEVEVLSDDRIIVRYDDGRDGPAGPTRMRMYGTPWHGEAMFASPNSAPLTRIFILEHGHGNVITRLTHSQAVGELFARAFVPFHRHEYVEAGLSFLEQLAESVPCYHYSFEPDERAVEKIQQFND